MLIVGSLGSKDPNSCNCSRGETFTRSSRPRPQVIQPRARSPNTVRWPKESRGFGRARDHPNHSGVNSLGTALYEADDSHPSLFNGWTHRLVHICASSGRALRASDAHRHRSEPLRTFVRPPGRPRARLGSTGPETFGSIWTLGFG